MTLVKTSLLNGIAVVVRLVTMVALNKILAIHVGPAGYAILAQFQSFLGILTTFASGAVNTGVTKYTAEHFNDSARQVSIWKTAGTVSLVGSIVTGLTIAALHRPLATLILKDESLASVFIWAGVCLVLFTLNGLLLAILNGKKEVNLYVLINILGSLVALLVTGCLATWFGLYGALLALAINQSIVFGITLALCWKTNWFQIHNIIGTIDTGDLRNLGKFTLMAATSALCLPTSQIFIRNHLGNNFGWEAAGHWEALVRISSLYLMVVTTPLAVYYLPRLSELRNNSDIKREIILGYRFILPLSIIGSISIYLIRDWLITTLFTPEFASMRSLFTWQLVGDVLKIGSWLLAHLMLAKAMVKTFVISELLFSFTLVLTTISLTGTLGIKGATMAYASSYALYWIAMLIIVNRRLALESAT